MVHSSEFGFMNWASDVVWGQLPECEQGVWLGDDTTVEDSSTWLCSWVGIACPLIYAIRITLFLSALMNAGVVCSVIIFLSLPSLHICHVMS